MDISQFTQQDRELEIVSPKDGTGTGFFITLRPMDSDEVTEVRNKQINARLKKRNKQITVEQGEVFALELLVAAVTGWRFEEGANIGGAQPVFTPQEAKKLLQKYKFVKKQVDDFLGDESNFF